MILARRAGYFPGLQIVPLAKRVVGVNFRQLKGGEVVYRTVRAMLAAHEKEL